MTYQEPYADQVRRQERDRMFAAEYEAEVKAAEERERLRNREKQARFREKRDAKLRALDEQARLVVDALADACERSGCHRLTSHLPEEPQVALAELVRRLGNVKLVVCKRGQE